MFQRIAALVVLMPMLARADAITVSAAISLKDAMNPIAADYAKQSPGDTVAFNFGASGTLLAQIKQGAPVDAFISAGQSQMDDAKKGGLVDASTEAALAGNALVLIVPKDAKAVPASFTDLADGKYAHVAIGQPKVVPAGQYAEQTLRAMKVWDALQPKLVFGENVRQVLDYVRRGEADAGLVYRTDAEEFGDQVRIALTADEASHKPIRYPAAVVKNAAHAAAAEKFLKYIESPAGQAVLAKHGFTPIDAPTTQAN